MPAVASLRPIYPKKINLRASGHIYKISFMKSRFGFTLIELIMVIVILGIIAAVTLPKFANFKRTAIEKSEDGIAAALNIAVKTNYVSYITAGGSPDTAPIVNPFILLAQAPPYYLATSPLSPDGTRWGYYPDGFYGYYIVCPHRDGNLDSSGASKGRFYIYLYNNNAPWRAGHCTGDFWLYDDKLHTY